MLAFRDEVLAAHQTQHINLLFNNAGIGGGGSFVEGDRGEWERTFAVCWDGVYFGCRAFMEALVASDEGHIVNTSSVNGFWASLGTTQAHTSYAAANRRQRLHRGRDRPATSRTPRPMVRLCRGILAPRLWKILQSAGKPWGHELPDEEVAYSSPLAAGATRVCAR